MYTTRISSLTETLMTYMLLPKISHSQSETTSFPFPRGDTCHSIYDSACKAVVDQAHESFRASQGVSSVAERSICSRSAMGIDDSPAAQIGGYVC